MATGQVIAPTVQQTRGEKDFAAHIEQTVTTDPEASWVFVVDNLTTHASATLVLGAASRCGVAAESLGQKGKSGVLASVATRRAFVTDAGHRVRFVYAPKHTSWLNQVEIWFSVLARRVLRRGNSRSVADLRDKILAYIAYHNRTRAKPYEWTYTGRPLDVCNQGTGDCGGGLIPPTWSSGSLASPIAIMIAKKNGSCSDCRRIRLTR